MSFRMRRGRTSFNLGSKSPRVNYRLGCAVTLALVVGITLTIAACGPPVSVEWSSVDLSLLVSPNFWASVGSIATALAFLLLLREARQRDQRQQEAQAASVSVWLKEMNANTSAVTVSNASSAPVYRVVLWLVRWQGGGGPQTGEEAARLYAAGGNAPATIALVPVGRHLVHLPPFDGGMYARPGVEIAFTDAANRHWVRRNAGWLQRLPREAVSHYHIDRPVDWVATVDPDLE